MLFLLLMARTESLLVQIRVEPQNRFGKSGQDDGADECPGHGSRETDVVVKSLEFEPDVVGGYAVVKNVMGGLDVE